MFNLLIVDDEEWILKGLQHKIEQSGMPFRIFVVEGTEEALAICEKIIPDVILCDIRLGQYNGLQLLNKLSMRFPKMKKIIISGYDDFDYTVQAIRLGSMDYLLKPIDSSALIRALERCTAMLESERKKESAPENNQRKKELGQLFGRYISGQDDRIETFMTKTASFISLSLYFSKDNLLKSIQVFDSFLETDVEFILGRNCAVTCYGENESILLIGGERYYLEKLISSDSLTEKISNHIRNQGCYLYTLGISQISESAKDAIRQSIYAMKYRVFMEENRLIVYQPDNQFDTPYVMHDNLRDFFLRKLSKSDTPYINDILEDVYLDIHVNAYKYDDIQKLYGSFISHLQNHLSASTFLKQLDLPHEIYMYDSLQEMMQQIKREYTDVIRNVELQVEPKLEPIYMIKEYIDNHYQEKISQEKMADTYHISTSYLSTLFHKTIGYSFQEYLTSVRINKAKHLLSANKYKVSDIAEMVGFSNAHYFSTIFKREEGLSPNQFARQFEKASN